VFSAPQGRFDPRGNGGDPTLADRTWVALTEAVPGGWGIAGHAYTNEVIVRHVRDLPGKA
jgi:hypothetical protein